MVVGFSVSSSSSSSFNLTIKLFISYYDEEIGFAFCSLTTHSKKKKITPFKSNGRLCRGSWQGPFFQEKTCFLKARSVFVAVPGRGLLSSRKTHHF